MHVPQNLAYQKCIVLAWFAGMLIVTYIAANTLLSLRTRG
jgi:hypothetical protein